MSLPKIAITCGDPAGVGPELCLKVVALESVRKSCIPIVFGDAAILARVAKQLDLTLPPVATDQDSIAGIETASLLDFRQLKADDVVPGVVNATTGRASYAYVDTAIDLALSGVIDGLVTGPISKQALHLAGISFPGHTEILAEKTSAHRICMMLTSDQITCSVVTAHVGLREVPELLTTDRIIDAIELSYEAMKRMRGRDVHVTVCGLNPHAGENGLFGNREEERVIQPAVEAAKAKGMQIVGPLPPDTAFLPANRQKTDCYICMYHDQGLIPLKTLAFDTAVNVTLGLPIVRTSVDHGTALDIAWQGLASELSFVHAVHLAVKLARPTR